jgi:hypothetical protein
MPLPSATFARAAASLLRIGGETISYQTAGGSGDPLDVTVIWSDNEAQMPKGVRATAWFIEADLPGVRIAKGDVFRRGDFTYRVVDQGGVIALQRDGYGGVTVFLRQVNHASDS